MSAPAQSDDLEASTEAAIAACDGDPRAAVRALLAVNYLTAFEAGIENVVAFLTEGITPWQDLDDLLKSRWP
jgi:hypothetical protein